ncbi:hypothetical protein FRC10_001322, partial [Ceratobasidium sp. 414]
MPRLPEGSKTQRQCALTHKDVFGKQVAKWVATEVKEMGPSGEPPACRLAWPVTKVLHRSRMSINVLQVVLAYLAGTKRIPQHVCGALSGMDWLGSESTPLPLVDPRRTFLASLVFVSKLLPDKAFSSNVWAKLSRLEALKVRKCERALSTALSWRLWVGREASRKSIVLAPSTHDYPSPAHLTLPMSPSSSFMPSLALSETSPESDAPHSYDEFSTSPPTLEMASEPEEMLHGSPLGYPSTAMGGSMQLASEPIVHTSAKSHFESA